MAISKILRTPIIKPRTQGGTFYTFSSAMEDIGINIAEQRNKISLSHYVLLNLPAFVQEEGSSSIYPDGSNEGDYIFAENLQNYALNMETVLRNQATYNFSSNRTVSERVFWKWLKHIGAIDFRQDNDIPEYYRERVENENNRVAVGFGRISASSQRSDDYSIYNETFVQIPSSYGKMPIYFRPRKDENLTKRTYEATNENGIIENISESELDASGNISATGITATAQYDSSDGHTYSISNDMELLEVEFDMDNLKKIFDNPDLTIDDIGMGTYGTNPRDITGYSFNAVLIYYSIYDYATNKTLATNAYGILLLNSSDEDHKIPVLTKTPSTPTMSGTSFSFRINVKTSSAYAGDITVIDNSTEAYAMSTDFNSVIRNLSEAIEVMKSNAATLRNIVSDNSNIKNLAMSALDKVDDIEKTVTSIKSGVMKESIIAGEVSSDKINVGSASENDTTVDLANENDRKTVDDVFSALTVKKTDDDGLSIYVETPNIVEDNVQEILERLVQTKDDMVFNDLRGIVALLVYKVRQLQNDLREFTERK